MTCRSHPFTRELKRSAVTCALLICGVMNVAAFDQVHRINSLTLQSGTDTYGTANRFGGAFTSSGLAVIQPAISNRVASGESSVLLVFSGLDDFSGVSDASIQIGVLNCAPFVSSNNPATYSGKSDLDWWYSPRPAQLDGSGAPSQQLSATISASVLNAGPGYFTFSTNQLFSGGVFAMSSSSLRATTLNPTTPLKSTNSFPPGHVLSENVPATLTTFSTTTNGQLKGNVSAESLANTPVPNELLASQSPVIYTSSNSMLDVLIGGMKGVGGLVVMVIVTQPDKVDANMPAAGSGGPYTFSADATTHKVTACKDSGGATVALDAGLKAAAYSVYFKFTTDRVIWVKPPVVAPKLTIAQPVVNQPLRLAFTNAPDLPFTIVATSNVNSPLTNWAVLGSPTQTSSGFYEFTDIANSPSRVYEVRSP